MIHKLIAPGGEKFLPFALTRERVLRAAGHQWIVQSFEVEGTKIRVRLEGEHSFIEISGGGAWVAYPARIGLRFSASNARPRLNFTSPEAEDPGPPPVRPADAEYPAEPTYPPPPLYVEPPVASPCPAPEDYVSQFPVHGYSCNGGVATDAGRRTSYLAWMNRQIYMWDLQTAAQVAAPNFNYAPIGPRPEITPTGHEGTSYPGFHGAYSDAYGFAYTQTAWREETFDMGGGWYTVDYFSETIRSSYSPAGDHDVTVYNIRAAWGVAKQAVFDANNAAYQAYSAALAAWEIKHNEYLAASADKAPCERITEDLKQPTASSRASQLAVLNAELFVGGMNALPLFNAVSRPAYVPMASPTTRFAAVSDPGIQKVWATPDARANVPYSATTRDATPRVSQCGSTTQESVYAGVVYGSGAAPDERLRLSTDRAYGFTVTTPAQELEPGPPPGAIVAHTPNYGEWVKSASSDTDRALDYDLTWGRSGNAFVVFLEYEVFDIETSAWMWVPAKELVAVPAMAACITGYCAAYSAPASEVPEYSKRVRAMRLLRVMKYAFSPKVVDGQRVGTAWGTGSIVQMPEGKGNALNVVFDTALPIDYRSMPELVVQLRDVATKSAPKVPAFSEAVTAKFVKEAGPPPAFPAVSNSDQLMHWIVHNAITLLPT